MGNCTLLAPRNTRSRRSVRSAYAIICKQGDPFWILSGEANEHHQCPSWSHQCSRSSSRKAQDTRGFGSLGVCKASNLRGLRQAIKEAEQFGLDHAEDLALLEAHCRMQVFDVAIVASDHWGSLKKSVSAISTFVYSIAVSSHVFYISLLYLCFLCTWSRKPWQQCRRNCGHKLVLAWSRRTHMPGPPPEHGFLSWALSHCFGTNFGPLLPHVGCFPPILTKRNVSKHLKTREF